MYSLIQNSIIQSLQILIIQTAFLGDVVLATPLVEKLRRHYPDAQIDFLVRKGNESLLTGHPHLREVLVWDKKQGKYRQLWQLLRRIRRTRYNWVVNCQRFAASGFLTAFSGASETTGFAKNPFSRLFSRRVPHQIGDAHEVERNIALIAHRTDSLPERPRLYPSEIDTTRATEAAAGRRYVCIAPTSVWFTKQWPEHKWVELIGQLPPEYAVLLLGAPADFDACERIRRAFPARRQVENLAGKLSLPASAALMRGAAMNYVNDSAPLHLASAMNAPVTAIFCSTIPGFGFTPLSDRSFVVETTQPLDCRPCGLHGFKACPRGHFACAEGIGIQQIITIK